MHRRSALFYNNYVLYLHVRIYTIDLSKNQDLTGAGHRIRTCDPLITNEGALPTELGRREFQFNTAFCEFPVLIFRKTTIIPAGVIPEIRDKSAMFSGRVSDSFWISSLVSPDNDL